jgi:hypothetical protein
MDIDSDYMIIEPSLAYWRQYAKNYPTLGRGVMAILSPSGSELKKYHTEAFLDRNDLLIEGKYRSVTILRQPPTQT